MQKRRPLHSVPRSTRPQWLAGLVFSATALAGAPAQAWDTVVVRDKDSMSSIFSNIGVAQRHLARVLAEPAAAKRLGKLRSGDVVELKHDGRKLLAIRLYDGKQKVSVTPKSGSGWNATSTPLTKRELTSLKIRKLEIVRPGAPGPVLVASASVIASAPAPDEPHTVAQPAAPPASKSPQAGVSNAVKMTVAKALTSKTSSPQPAKVTIEPSAIAPPAPAAIAVARLTARRVVVGLEQQAVPAPRTTRTMQIAKTLTPKTLTPKTPGATRTGTPLRLAGQVRQAELATHARRLTMAPRSAAPLETGPTVMPAVARANTRANALGSRQNPASRPSPARALPKAPAFAKVVLRAERAMRKRRAVYNPRRLSISNNDPRIATVLSGARGHIGVPYLWGGNSPSEGFDCSGLVTYHMKRVGVRVPRTAHTQFIHTKSRPITKSQLKPGDLVFFRDNTRPGRIGHVGIYIGKDRFIHAVGDDMPVQITPMSRPHYARRFVRGGRILG